ncbi:MAG: succinyl-diaminopimelate desuccinylase [Woeseiaceae bacterium]|nr:succinyl-diaminopimelate desuccinylase [Woeseiaceae bacterium]
MTNLIKSPEIDLLCELVKRKSVTPDDAGCQELLIERLQAMGFECETMRFGNVTNLWARRGTTSPVLCFAGHTDVVPPGDETQWSNDPFQPTIMNDIIYGRGTADMKSGLASMIVAIENFLQANSQHNGSIAMLITSDEEGRARDGTLKVMEEISKRGESIDWCVIGEPSSQDMLGDLIRIGRRGSLSGILKVMGTQGHVAYPHLSDNPIRRFAPVLSELHNIEWDQGNKYFPPTSFQVVDIKSGVGAPNVTPAELSARFNFRYSNVWDHESLKKRVHEVFEQHDIDYELSWHLSGEPFLTKPGRLIDVAIQAITESTGKEPLLSTGGGTSDGRFISPAGVDVVELGPVNASIHKIDEHVRIDDVIKLTGIYTRMMQLLL